MPIHTGEEIVMIFIACKQILKPTDGYEGPFLEGKRPRREVYQLTTCQTKVQNAWFSASTPIRLNGMIIKRRSNSTANMHV
jgi:hypothetical protein